MFSAELMKFIMSAQEEDTPEEVKSLEFDKYDVREIFYAPRKPVKIPIYREK